jgi:hypothetical protein
MRLGDQFGQMSLGFHYGQCLHESNLSHPGPKQQAQTVARGRPVPQERAFVVRTGDPRANCERTAQRGAAKTGRTNLTADGPDFPDEEKSKLGTPAICGNSIPLAPASRFRYAAVR